MRTLCIWYCNFMAQCIFYTVSMTVQRKKNRFLLCWRHILITLLPGLNPTIERQKQHYERNRSRKAMGPVPAVRRKNALTAPARNGAESISAFLPELQAREHHQRQTFYHGKTARRQDAVLIAKPVMCCVLRLAVFTMPAPSA